MAARTPPEAFARFLKPLQQAVSCVTHSVLVGRGHRPNTPYTLTFGGGRSAPLTGPHDAALFISVTYVVEPELGGWAVHYMRYIYNVLSASTEVLGYHWHPEDRGPTKHPHLHIYGQTAPVSLRKMHLPTGQIRLEDVLRLVISDFDVTPLREDWETVLASPETS